MRSDGPRLLVTGFGPYPGAPKNPTDMLVAAIAGEGPSAFGAGALKAAVLPTDYRRSWTMLRRLYAAFEPDVVVHFGLSLRCEAIHVEQDLLDERCQHGRLARLRGVDEHCEPI